MNISLSLLDTIHHSDTLTWLLAQPDDCINTCVTSPPYFHLRNYEVAGQIGQEATPDEYVANLINVFREVRRVLRKDGSLWLNLGDSYWAGKEDDGLKAKDLIGIPWMTAFALRADGWYLRTDIIWQKPNTAPESCRDRVTRSHECLFLLTKSARYFYDQDAVKEPIAACTQKRVALAKSRPVGAAGNVGDGRDYKRCRSARVSVDRFPDARDHLLCPPKGDRRNKRSVWTIPIQPYRNAHIAVMPEKLVEPCIRAGCPPGGVVLDPFMGAGTVAVVARRLGRHYVGTEIHSNYVELANERLRQEGESSVEPPAASEGG
jgi:DNA modification methylase